MSLICSDEPVLLSSGWPFVRFTPKPGQYWTRLEGFIGIIVFEEGKPPTRHYVEFGRHCVEEVTLH